MKRRMLCSSVLLLAVFAFTGCRVPKPTAIYIQACDQANQELMEAGKILLLSDVCLMHENKYFMLGESQKAQECSLEHIGAYLAGKGYAVDTKMGPFVGGFKNASLKFAVAVSDGETATNTSAPFFHDAALENDRDYLDAMQKLEWYAQFCFDKGFHRRARFSVNPHVKTWVKTIAGRTGAETIILVNGNGQCYSVAKEMTKSIAVGILTGVISGGTVVVVPGHRVSYLDGYVSVIDAEDGRMIWSNSLRVTGDPSEEDFYKKKWPHSLFYHLPSMLAQNSNTTAK